MTETKQKKSETWLGSWVGYHLHRMEAVEAVEDIALLMRFGASEVRRTFDGVDHADIFRHLVAQRAHRAKARASLSEAR